MRRADVLAARQGRAALRRRHAPRRGRLRPPQARRVSDLHASCGRGHQRAGILSESARPRSGRGPGLPSSTAAGDRRRRVARAWAWSTRSSAATRGRRVAENWPRFLEVWRPLVRFAEEHGVRIGIENCPMYFTGDEWPGGKNLAHSPAVWRRMFAEIPSPTFGLNYDPSHLVWQQMDYVRPLAEFAGADLPRPREGRRGRSAAAGRRGHPGHAAGVSHAEAARPRGDRLAAVSRGARASRLRRARCASRWKTASTKARSRPGSRRSARVATSCETV